MPKINIREHLDKLGIKKLKPKQKEIINLFLKKQDVIGILPTGYGKSLCYILPFLLKNKNVLVISPLISLMKDQYVKLQKLGIPTLVFNSSHKKLRDTAEGQSKLSGILKGDLKYLMYFSPESFIRNKFLIEELYKKKRISLIAIDESHCVSTWSEFRTDYKELHIINDFKKEYKTKFSTIALTATATDSMRTNIINILHLDKPFLVKGSSYKHNLELFIRNKKDLESNIEEIYKNIIDNGKENKCIIYCKTKKDTETLSEKLKQKGILCEYYHAGLETNMRDKIQMDFTANKINVITATIAFGMGIDIPDIHLIIHYGISKNIESYYQEIGRGGRDGEPVKCFVYWSARDFMTNKYFIKQIKDKEFRNYELYKLIQLEKYIYTRKCRMRFICNYFEDSIKDCGKCDNCLLKIQRDKIQKLREDRALGLNFTTRSNNQKQTLDNMFSLIDKFKIKEISNNSINNPTNIPEKLVDLSYNRCLTEDFITMRYIILQVFTNFKGGLGITKLSKILKGNIKEYKSCSNYGKLKKHTLKDIKNYIKKVNYSNYIEKKTLSSMAFYYVINKSGLNWLSHNKKIIKKSIKKIKPLQLKIKKLNKDKFNNSDLYKNLLKWRNKKAKEINKPSYCIINNKVIQNIVIHKPSTLKELLKIKGIGQKKIDVYGKNILDILNN